MTYKTLLILSVLWLFGCATEKEIVIQYKEVKKEIIIIDIKKMEDLYKINVLVDNENNIILTEEENKKMIYNLLIMKKQIIYLKDIIKYYEDNIKN